MPSFSLTLGSLTVYAVLAFFLWYTTSAVYAWWGLRRVPGPFLASFSYLWVAWHIVRGTVDVGHKSLQKYGPLARTGPGYVVTHDPEVIRRIMAARGSYGKHAWWGGARSHPTEDSILSTVDMARHDEIKAQTANGYNGRDGTDVHGRVDRQVERLVGLVRRRFVSAAGARRVVDLTDLMRFFTLDVTTDLSYGRPFGFLDEGKDLFDFNRTMDAYVSAMTLGLDVPFFRNLMRSPLMAFLLPKDTDNSGAGKIMGIAQEIVRDRFENDKRDEKDMLGSFMRHGLTQAQCEAETFVQIAAGSDTTGSLLSTTMLYIITTPRVYQRLKEEIRAAVAAGSVSYPIALEQAKKLPYLQAVISEGFRMRPPVPYGAFMSVPPRGDTIHGVYLPGGTGVGFNIVAMMRCAETFGVDVDVFRPERFLECDDDARRGMLRQVDMAFGTGRLLCAGKQVALLELNKVFFELMRAFDFQLVDPRKGWRERALVVSTQNDMWVTITEDVLG
ncbi:cytochrome P450 [Colletotrichum tabaci]|uniref:Cytochrome P450 n=1 Tax=Colletotrichum tabaci TaxID=1209068 RepID=A0AAV9TL91_9PEZI